MLMETLSAVHRSFIKTLLKDAVSVYVKYLCVKPPEAEY